MSGEVIKVLPPKTTGETQGCLQMSVKTIRWFRESPGEVAVITEWWGDQSQCKFFPKDENQENAAKRHNKSYVFNIRSSKEQFGIYLAYHKRLKFIVLKQKEIIGVGVLEDLTKLYRSAHFDDFVDIHDGESLIADIRVCFNLKFFPPNSPRNHMRNAESFEDELYPRKAVPCYSEIETFKTEFSQKIDLEPRAPVYNRWDVSERLLDILRAEKEASSLLDITNFQVTDGSDEDKYTPSTLSSSSSILSLPNRKNLESHAATTHLLNYLSGVDLSDENQKKAVELLRKISPSSSLIDFIKAGITEKVLDDQSPRKGIPPAPSVYHPKYQSENLSQNKPTSPMKSQSIIRPSALSNAYHDSKLLVSPALKNKFSKGCSPSRSSSDISSKIHYYRISLDRIIFNADGLRKLHGTGHIKSHQENNCPSGNYIIQYQLSKVDPKFLLEKTGHVRHVSKKTLANGVIFGENDVYKVRDMRSDDVVTGFKISVQYLNQRIPLFLGDTESLVIRESSKHTLFIKSVNGLTIGKLDVQIDVANSLDTLPPPETFSEMCKEEIDELIPSTCFQNFKTKSNNSKYLTLKAQYRNSSNEKLKNVPSAQYSSFLDSQSSVSKDLSETAMPQRSHSFSFPTEPTTEFSSDLSTGSGSLNKEIPMRHSYPGLVNSADNLKTHDNSHQMWKNSQDPEKSNSKTVLKDLNSAAPLKYAIITHEFYVNVKNLVNFEDGKVNYVFPEGTTNERGKVTIKWAVASPSTNLSRPFFISLPYGLTLKQFLKKTGKKSVGFFFKHPLQEKTIAKAVLNFADIYRFEKAFKSSSSKSIISKTFTLPIIERNYDCTVESAEIRIEYCNRICKFANEQDVPISSSTKSNDFKLEDYLKTSTDNQRTNCNESEHLEKMRADRDSVAAHILNTTFCVSSNENGSEVNQQNNQDYEKSEGKLVDNHLLHRGGGDFSNVHFSNKDHLSTILECSESSRNMSKENHSSSNIINPTVKTQDVFYPNKEFILKDLQSFSSLKIAETDGAYKQTQGTNAALTSVPGNLSSHLAPTFTNSGSNLKNSAPISQEGAQSSFSSPYTKLTFSGGSVINGSKVSPNHAKSSEVKSERTKDFHEMGSHYSNEDKKKAQESFVVPNTSPALSNEFISSNAVEPEFACSGNVDSGSSDSGSRAEDKVFDDYDSKCDTFKVGPVLPDCENDAIPKNFSPLDPRRVAQNFNVGNAFNVNENSDSTCLTEAHLNVSVSEDSTETLGARTPRRNSDSGFIGVSARDSLEQNIRESSRNQFSSEPNIRKQATVIPQVDDFGISLKNKSQDKCFLARIGIVRSLNIPMIKLKGTKQQTQPTTYVTFNDCFKQSHCSSTVVESLTPEYDSRHKAWLSTELLKDQEERLVFQVWCKRYEKEWAGPDCERDRCLGYVSCDLSILMHNFRYAGGWHEIISASGKVNGHIQILVKPLQNIDFVKNLECEELVHDTTNLVHHLQPYNYYLNSMNKTQNDGISSKQRLSQNIIELEETIKELQISHENRQTKSQEYSMNKNTPEDKSTQSESTDSDRENPRDSYNERINQLPWVSKEDPSKRSTPTAPPSKSAARMLANCLLSLRKKPRKPKKLPIAEEDSRSLTSDSVTDLEVNKTPKQAMSGNGEVPATFIDGDNQSPKIGTPKSEVKSVKKTPSFFSRSFSFQLKKSKNKQKVHQNALLQTLPLYEYNVEDKTEKPIDDKSTPNRGRDFYVQESNTRYHSL